MPLDPLPPQLQRARGRVEVAVSRREGRIRLDRLFQEGCGKAILPRVDAPVPEVVLINTSGGVTGGDRIGWRLEAGPGAALVATSQAAERVYRSSGGAARVETRLVLGAGAALDWLPQETILFDGGAARTPARGRDGRGRPPPRARDASSSGAPPWARWWRPARSRDQWRIRRGGPARACRGAPRRGAIAAAGAGPATLRGARAFATLVHVAPDAEARLAAARTALAADGVLAAASAKPGVLIVRWLAPDAQALRAGLIRFLIAFRNAPLPRVWTS